jgi:hypothetical protein
MHAVRGDALGAEGNSVSQLRGVLEAGYIF